VARLSSVGAVGHDAGYTASRISGKAWNPRLATVLIKTPTTVREPGGYFHALRIISMTALKSLSAWSVANLV
jgi:hypothetical protein